MGSTTEGNRIAARGEWLGLLQQTASEVFAMMLSATVTVTETSAPAQVNVTGVVGIGGAVRAVLSMRCSLNSSIEMAAKMLGVPVAEAESQRCDAVGEICNILAGDFKKRIGLGDKCVLSIPTVIAGGDYRIHSVLADERLELSLVFEGEPIWIALEIRK